MRLGEFEKILAGAGLGVPRRALERGYEASAAFLSGVWRAHRDVPVHEHVRALLAGADPALPERVSPAILGSLVEAYARPALLVPPTVDPGAHGALTALRALGLTLAVVSNTMRTPGATLRKLLASYRLLDCFTHTTFSDEVGVRKPAPEIFWLTLRAVGAEPETAVHVGDDPVLDVGGARAAGMRVVQVTTSPPRGPREGGPHAVIPQLAALPDAIARLQ